MTNDLELILNTLIIEDEHNNSDRFYLYKNSYFVSNLYFGFLLQQFKNYIGYFVKYY